MGKQQTGGGGDEIETGNALVTVERPSMALLRAERESAFDLARRYPRNEDQVHKRALTELRRDPSRAPKLIYDIPYKKRAGQGEGGPVEHVVGLNIHCALDLRRLWGNNLAAARIIDESDDGADIDGYFLDFETNSGISRPVRVSRWKKVDKRLVRIAADRWDQALGIGASKAVRNAIFQGLPSWLRDSVFQEVKRLITGAGPNKQAEEAPLEVVRQKLTSMADWFGHPKRKVTIKEIERFLGVEWNDAGSEELVRLVGVAQSIKDGITSVEKVFRPKQTIQEATAQAASNVDALVGSEEDDEDGTGGVGHDEGSSN